jgi:hypothetical protein
MNKRVIIIMIMLGILAIGVEFIIKQKNGGLDEKQVELTQTKTYTQGQWDGVNIAVKYLQDTHQIDSVTLDIHILDSMLTVKSQK